MRNSILVMIVVFGSAIAFQATAQQKPGPQQPAPSEQMQRDADTGLKSSGPSEQMQRDADKGVKTRNSGDSGFVAGQDKPGAAAHPPGQPESEQTTGSSTQSGAAKAQDKSR